MSWYQRARSRMQPVADLGRDSGLYFPPDRVPLLALPQVQALGPDAAVLLQKRTLIRYLHGTQVLETQVVNPVLAVIASASKPFPDSARIEALQLGVDESWHALHAGELLAQLDPQSELEGSIMLQLRLAKLEANKGLGAFFFVFVSETLISETLRQVGNDARIHPQVRRFVSEHARDEARHATFFTARMTELWAHVGDAVKDRWGPRLPDLLAAFLDPVPPHARHDLQLLGLDPSLATRLPPPEHREAAQPCIRAAQRAGMLDHPPTRQALAQAGLLEA